MDRRERTLTTSGVESELQVSKIPIDWIKKTAEGFLSLTTAARRQQQNEFDDQKPFGGVSFGRILGPRPSMQMTTSGSVCAVAQTHRQAEAIFGPSRSTVTW